LDFPQGAFKLGPATDATTWLLGGEGIDQMADLPSIMSPLRIGLLVGLLIPASVYAQSRAEVPDAMGSWRLVSTPNPRGGANAVSIMHTADTSRSDLDLAGLMIRCNGDRTELAVVVLTPFSLRARPRVALGSPPRQQQFDATIGPPGTAIVLPGDPKALLGEAWTAESDLSIRVTDGTNTFSGVVPLAGIQSASVQLKANCPTP
jgi:hypothetical protein